MTEAQSPRQRIRVAVQSLHRELDSQPILQGLAQAPLHGKAAYLRSLRFLLPYWQAFAHFHPVGQAHYQALIQDIDEPDCLFPVHPELNHRPKAFHYVMWGSTLGGRDFAVLSVEDSGVGMTPQQVASATEPFVRFSDRPGSGLGLSIVNQLIPANGGQLNIESETGKGTCVEAKIPLAVNRMDIQKPVAGLLVN